MKAVRTSKAQSHHLQAPQQILRLRTVKIYNRWLLIVILYCFTAKLVEYKIRYFVTSIEKESKIIIKTVKEVFKNHQHVLRSNL